MDFDLTPRLKSFNNHNLLWFDQTSVLQQFLFQGNIHHSSASTWAPAGNIARF